MKIVRFISSALFALTRFLSLIYFATGIYGIVALASGSPSLVDIADERFVIYYPFTESPFLLGDYNQLYILEMFGVVLIYGLFFWLLSGVFSAFRQPKLFTIDGVRKLSRFYILNLVVPPLALLLMLIFSITEVPAQLIAVLHIIIGVFAFFMAAIFRQGLNLQNEQDYTI